MKFKHSQTSVPFNILLDKSQTSVVCFSSFREYTISLAIESILEDGFPQTDTNESGKPDAMDNFLEIYYVPKLTP